MHSAAIHLLRWIRRVDEETGLSPARLSALSVVVFVGPLSLGELAAAERVTPPTMTRLVAGLHAEGLVRRDPHPEDRRAVRIRATAKGTALLQRARDRRVQRLVGRMRTMDSGDIRAMARAARAVERITDDLGRLRAPAGSRRRGRAANPSAP
jgi:DNA-binding MarR family transcriptional regulator